MTVAELIARLQSLPPSLPVVVQVGRNELGNGRGVGGVEVVDVVRWVGSNDGWRETEGEDWSELERRTVVNIHS